jgi:hypothetical protein
MAVLGMHVISGAIWYSLFWPEVHLDASGRPWFW